MLRERALYLRAKARADVKRGRYRLPCTDLHKLENNIDEALTEAFEYDYEYRLLEKAERAQLELPLMKAEAA